MFQRPSRLSHRIGLFFRPCRPVATRRAVPNPDRRLVKPSTEALPANRFLPPCRSVPVVDPMAAARRPRLQRRLSRNEYKYHNPLSRHSLSLTICLLSFFEYFALSSSGYFLFSLFLCCYFHSISFLSFLLGCQVGRHHQGASHHLKFPAPPTPSFVDVQSSTFLLVQTFQNALPSLSPLL